MEKRLIAFFVIVFAAVIVWSYLFKSPAPRREPEPAPATEEPEAESETEGEETPPAEGEETAPKEGEEAPDEPEITEGPEAGEVEVADEVEVTEQVEEFEPQLHELSNPFATFQISTRGGVVRQVTMETKETSKDHGIVIHGDEKYDFCPVKTADSEDVPQRFYPLAIFSEDKDGLDLAEAEFKMVEAESGDRTLVLRHENKRFTVTKTFTLPEEGYRLEVRVAIRNTSGASLKLPEYSIQVGSVHPVDDKDRQGETRVTVDSGSARKYKPAVEKKTPRQEPMSIVRWAAISNKYFAAILDARGRDTTGEIKTRWIVSEVLFLRYADERKRRKVFATGLSVTLPDLRLGKDQEQTFELALYVGPKEHDRLRPLGYSKVMGTTFLAPLAGALMVVLNVIYGFIPNYGVAIIVLTAAVKLLLFPLDRRSFKSMKEMQKIQPLIKQLQEKYKDDKRQLQVEQMKLFKEHKVNPLGGCLPILLQFPVLIAMFTMLRNAVELWRAPFVSYITDLSKPDTLLAVSGFEVHILPVLMTVFTILSQRLRGKGQTVDPQQKMMGQMMPLIFLFIFYSFPSGLNLYWLCSTVFSFGVQLVVQKGDETQAQTTREGAA